MSDIGNLRNFQSTFMIFAYLIYFVCTYYGFRIFSLFKVQRFACLKSAVV